MTPDKLLQKAKENYPIGTKFKCANGNIDEDNWNISKASVNGVFTVLDHNYLNTGSNKGVYSCNGWIVINDQWAEIVDKSNVNYDYLVPILNKYNIK